MGIWDKFVVLEGLDGSGTTTQLKRLGSYCSEKGIPYYQTFEPSDGFIGRAARDVLEKREQVHPLTLAQLFVADRREHLALMQRRLEAGEWVFCDRYLFSSLAYQSLGVDFEQVLDLNRDFPLPGFCLYLECSVETSASRRDIRESVDLFEKENLQRKVRAHYEHAFAEFYAPDGASHPEMGFYRVDGEESVERVFSRLLEILKI